MFSFTLQYNILQLQAMIISFSLGSNISLATVFCMSRLHTTSLDLCDIIGVSQLMIISKEHYSLTERRKTHSDIRPCLILMAKQFVTEV